MTPRWHITDNGTTLTLSRRLPARFDIAARTALPACRPLRLAHQIRQDIWRALQRLRGFSPVVEITRDVDIFHIRAGGQAPHPIAAKYRALLQDTLDNPNTRARWLSFARPAPSSLQKYSHPTSPQRPPLP